MEIKMNSAPHMRLIALFVSLVLFLSQRSITAQQDRKSASDSTAPSTTTEGIKKLSAGSGKYELLLDTSETPELREWAENELAPVMQKWYPEIIQMLPSDGYQAPTNVTIQFSKEMRGVAATSGTKIRCAAKWFSENLKGEAKGAVFHELVHVVQNYGLGRRKNPDGQRMPGWLVEGIADYLRWYKYEPESKGAEITKRNLSRARYDASYRPTANFLNWTVSNYSPELVVVLNAAAREGKYNDDLWKEKTGKTVQELGNEWKTQIERKLIDAGELVVNGLTEEEKKAGWKLLFNGKDFDGWHVFKMNSVRPGWQVKDGALVCADPHNAGDLCTDQQFDWFELELEYNISAGGNSGIIYHVTDEGGAVWATGPEFQLEDNKEAKDPIRCGWLYALYQPPNDPATGKPLDKTKPTGEWNRIRLVISPEKCEHVINGVKYFEYDLHSDDFKERVAKSKFGKMPLFAKSDKGYIALQGDHGQVSFRNIKIRPLETKKN
jgi:hypothetical protein